MLRRAGRVLTRRVAPATGATLAVGSAAFYASDPKTASRTYVLLTEMAPVILAYRFVEKKQQIRKWLNHENPALEDAEWDALHDKYAKSTVDTMRRMLGSYVKLGQFLALRPDIVPQVWTDELRTLESAVPAQSTQLVHETIQRAYGKKVEEIFAEFDNKPVGSASIGQVHRATLKDGTRVAVKVQYGAGNERVMRNDIKHGKELFRWLAPEQVAVLDEVEAQFATEFDYRREASHLSQVRSNLQKAGFLGSWWRRGVVDIPEPITDMCTKEVLVMRFLEGDNLVDGIRALGERAAKRQGLTLDDLKRDMLIKFEREGYPEPYAGPSPFMIEAYRYVDRVRCYPVWKSNFGRPTPSTRYFLRSCVCSHNSSLVDFHTALDLGDVVLELVRARLRLAPQPGPARRDEVLDLRPLLVVDVVVRGRGGVGRRRRVGLLRRARELEPRRARRRRRGRGLGDALGLCGGAALREERRGAVRAAPRVLLRPRGDAAVPVPYPVLLVGLDERLAPEPV